MLLTFLDLENSYFVSVRQIYGTHLKNGMICSNFFHPLKVTPCFCENLQEHMKDTLYIFYLSLLVGKDDTDL